MAIPGILLLYICNGKTLSILLRPKEFSGLETISAKDDLRFVLLAWKTTGLGDVMKTENLRGLWGGLYVEITHFGLPLGLELRREVGVDEGEEVGQIFSFV